MNFTDLTVEEKLAVVGLVSLKYAQKIVTLKATNPNFHLLACLEKYLVHRKQHKLNIIDKRRQVVKKNGVKKRDRQQVVNKDGVCVGKKRGRKSKYLRDEDGNYKCHWCAYTTKHHSNIFRHTRAHEEESSCSNNNSQKANNKSALNVVLDDQSEDAKVIQLNSEEMFEAKMAEFKVCPPILLHSSSTLHKMSEQRATKSGLAAEAQQKIHSKFDSALAQQIMAWVSQNAGEQLPTSGDVNQFLDVLKDGTVLCKLANGLSPGVVKKVNTSTMAFKQMENISFFLAFAEKYISKNELFQTVDLYERQDPNSVLVCLAALARKSEKAFGKPGLGPKEADGEKKEWTAEQLRAGEAVIGLQMGSNKGANQSGMIMGNTRHM